MRPSLLKFDFKQQLEKPDTLDLFIYDVVAPNDYDWWTGETIESETSADFFRKKLAEYSNIAYINLYINSVGGSVLEGYGIYAQLMRHPAYKTGYDDGFANSIASIIFQACNKRIMRINSVQGIHNMIDGCWGNAAAHRQCADNLDSLMEGNRQLYLLKAEGKITLEKLTELLDAETILTAQECLDYGLCDEIAELTADSTQMAQVMQRINANMASQIKYFQMLKQSMGDATAAIETPKQQTPPEPIEPPPPANPPQDNKTLKFLNALITGGKD